MKTLNFKQTGIATLALAASLTGAAHAASEPRLIINGQPFETRISPVVQDGRVLVPLRDIFENLGAHVDYDRADRTISARREGTHITMRLDSDRARVDGRPVRLDVPATAVNGATMVPLRFVSEALGAQVDFNSFRNVVRIQDGKPDRGPDRGPDHRPDRDSDHRPDRDRDRDPHMN